MFLLCLLITCNAHLPLAPSWISVSLALASRRSKPMDSLFTMPGLKSERGWYGAGRTGG